MVKPGSKDKQHKILITDQELVELKKFTGLMCEAFGLDRKVEKYKGTKPIGFWRWDLDCLESITEYALEDDSEYPNKSSPEYDAMKSLYQRVKELRHRAYNDIGGE